MMKLYVLVSWIEWVGKNAYKISSLIALVLRIMFNFGIRITFNRQKSFKNAKGEVCGEGGATCDFARGLIC